MGMNWTTRKIWTSIQMKPSCDRKYPLVLLGIEPARHVLLPRTRLDDAGNASLGEVSPTVEESILRTRHADRTPSDAFPAAQ